MLRNVCQSAGGVTFSQDAIRLLSGTRLVIEYTLANAHKMADAASQMFVGVKGPTTKLFHPKPCRSLSMERKNNCVNWRRESRIRPLR